MKVYLGNCPINCQVFDKEKKRCRDCLTGYCLRVRMEGYLENYPAGNKMIEKKYCWDRLNGYCLSTRVKICMCTRNRRTGYCGVGGCVQKEFLEIVSLVIGLKARMKTCSRSRPTGYCWCGREDHNVLQEPSDWLPFWGNDKRCCGIV